MIDGRSGNDRYTAGDRNDELKIVVGIMHDLNREDGFTEL